MKKLLSLVAISLMLLGFPNAHARNSAETYDNKFYSQQEFVQAYNNTTAPMYRDYVVGLDVTSVLSTSPTVNPNNNLGQYITEATGSTTDNIYAFGVVDDSIIPAGQLGRIAIRGPHKVVVKNNGTTGSVPAFATTAGTVISQCASNVPLVFNATLNNTLNGGVACAYTTATGTAGSMIGYTLSSTATTDTGDQGTAGATGSEYWVWVQPQVLR